MSAVIQNFVALLLVGGCVGYVAWQLLRTVRSGNGKAGSCCSNGCGDGANASSLTPGGKAAGTTPREQFIPSDTLRRKR